MQTLLKVTSNVPGLLGKASASTPVPLKRPAAAPRAELERKDKEKTDTEVAASPSKTRKTETEMKKPAAAPQKTPETTPVKTPNKGNADLFGQESETEKTPRGRLPTAKTPDSSKPEVLKKPASKAAAAAGGRNTDVVETVHHHGGWKVLKIKTPKGRVYPKFVAPDDTYFFSLKQAQENGFSDNPC